MRFTFFSWLPLAIVTTLLCGIIYVTVHQNYRQSANDPQIQLAEDIAQDLKKGASLEGIMSKNEKIDIETSLAPFVVVYDRSGKPVAGSGEINGELPTLPPGVFSYTEQHGEDRVTWQTKSGARSAIVIVAYSGEGNNSGFVMAGRSLREVEDRTGQLTVHIAVLWALTCVLLWGTVAFLRFWGKRMGKKYTKNKV